MKKPNLFVIGAAKAGTTTLHDLLNQHPSIFMSYPKEPGFFIGIESGKVRGKIPEWKANLNGYLKLFEKGRNAVYRGESSTGYTQLPWRPGVAERIYQFNSDAKLIYLVREPIIRTISHYWWNVRWEKERRNIEDAIIKDSYYRDISNYPMQLKPYLDLFGIERIKVLSLESLTTNTREKLKEIFDWLGVDPYYANNIKLVRKNATPPVIEVARVGLANRIKYSKAFDYVRPLIPEGIVQIGKKIFIKEIDRRSVNLRLIVDFLRPLFLEQIAELEKLLGMNFSEWKELYEDGS